MSDYAKNLQSIDKIVEIFLGLSMSFIASLYIKGYIDITYDQMRGIILNKITDSLSKSGITKPAQATLLGMNIRTYHDNLKRYTDNQRDTSHNIREMFSSLLVYIHSHKRGISRRELLEHFKAHDKVTEDRILTILEVLRHDQLVFETGGRGDNTIYVAPIVDLPIHDVNSIPAAFEDHMGALVETLMSVLQQTLFGQENNAKLCTVEFDVGSDSPISTEIQALYDDFEQKLREIWEQSESITSTKGKQTTKIYFGINQNTEYQ